MIISRKEIELKRIILDLEEFFLELCNNHNESVKWKNLDSIIKATKFLKQAGRKDDFKL